MQEIIIPKIWLKNTENNMLFQILETERRLYDPVKTVDATEGEIKLWEKGKYWDSIKQKEEPQEKNVTIPMEIPLMHPDEKTKIIAPGFPDPEPVAKEKETQAPNKVK